MKKVRLFLVGALSIATLAMNAQNGVDFDGVDDIITTNYAGIAGNNARTVEAWVKAPLTTGQVVITDWGTFGTGTRFTFALINGLLRVEVQGSGQSGTTMVGDNTWHHVAVTYDNAASPNKYSMYIDGVLELSFNLATSVNTGAAVPFQIGNRIDGAKPFAGTIDEVKVWDYARTQSEIAADMNTEYCTATTGLMAYHKLNNGLAGGTNTGVTTSADDSGLGNDGTLSGFTLAGATSNWIAGQSLGISAVSGSQTLSECDGYSITVGSNTHTTTGIYQDTLVGASVGGCDSIVTTDLTVAVPIDVTTSTAGTVITATTTGASYQWIDCNNSNAYITGETGQSYTATVNGGYAVEITVGNCTDTSACENIIILGMDIYSFKADVKLFPNPTNGNVTISLAHLTGKVNIDVLEITGKSVFNIESNQSNTVLDLNHLNDGIYFIRITNNDHQKTVRLIKL